MRSDIHSAIEIKAMGPESLDPRIEREVLAIALPGVLDEPIKESGAKSPGTVGIVRDQIVDIKGAAREEHVENAKAGHRSDDPVELKIGKLISLFLLLKDAGGEINCLEVRAQLSHHRAAPADLLRRFRQRNLPRR